MGRMKKEHKIITDYKLTLTYTCPITNEPVTIELNKGFGIHSYSSPCDLCGMHGSIDIEVPDKCPSCSKRHNNIEWESW